MNEIEPNPMEGNEKEERVGYSLRYEQLKKEKKFNRLKIVLAEKEIAGKELAEALGKNVNTVSRWVNNKQQPDIETLFNIADFLEVYVDRLLISNNPPPPF